MRFFKGPYKWLLKTETSIAIQSPASRDHPVGTGVGAAGGAVAGAALGSWAVRGTLVGGVVGAVAGGLAGKATAEAVNPTAEETRWRENCNREPYYEHGRSFDALVRPIAWA